MTLPYRKVEAFKLWDDTVVYETERDVLIAAIRATLMPKNVAESIYDGASALLPLLQRAVVVQSELKAR